jgi:hypothetical protein
MNERIKQLRDQAAFDANKGFTVTGSHKIWTDLFSEKFAELIVQECGQYLNSPEFIGRSDLDWAMVLNEHFGVE